MLAQPRKVRGNDLFCTLEMISAARALWPVMALWQCKALTPAHLLIGPYSEVFKSADLVSKAILESLKDDATSEKTRAAMTAIKRLHPDLMARAVGRTANDLADICRGLRFPPSEPQLERGSVMETLATLYALDQASNEGGDPDWIRLL